MVFPINVLAAGELIPSGDVVLTNPLGVNTIPQVLDRIINFMIILAGPIAVLMLVYAGYLFVVGGGSEEKVKTAKRIILGVVIGISILVLSKALVYVTCNVLGTSCATAAAPATPPPAA